MWNLVRTLLFALAVAGFVGQSSAHATPFQVFEATGGMADMDCAEMMVMAEQPSGGAMRPCNDLRPRGDSGSQPSMSCERAQARFH